MKFKQGDKLQLRKEHRQKYFEITGPIIYQGYMTWTGDHSPKKAACIIEGSVQCLPIDHLELVPSSFKKDDKVRIKSDRLGKFAHTNYTSNTIFKLVHTYGLHHWYVDQKKCNSYVAIATSDLELVEENIVGDQPPPKRSLGYVVKKDTCSLKKMM